MAKDRCPNVNNPDWLQLVDKVGESNAYWIYEEAGRIPKGEDLEAWIKRADSRDHKSDDLSNKADIEDIRTKLVNPDVEYDIDRQVYINKKTQEIVSTRVSNIVNEYYRSQGTRFKNDNTFFALKGTVVHQYISGIINAINAGETISYDKINKQVLKLKETKEFGDKKDSFFKMHPNHFKILREGVQDLVKEIRDVQKSIDPDGKVEFFTEIPIYNPAEDTAGTIDFLALFSDGSASVYDWKSFSSEKKEEPTGTKIGAWDVQLSQYRHILKNNYGINRFRHTRAIPIRTSFNFKNPDTGEWVNQYEEGFRVLSMKTKSNNLDYLKPVPFREDTGDENLNKLVESLYKKIDNIEGQIPFQTNKDLEINLKSQKKRLQKVVKDLELNQDINNMFNYLRNLARVSKNRIAALEGDPDYMNVTEMVNMINELKLFSNLVINFKNQLKKYSGDERKKLATRLSKAQEYATDLIDDLNKEILDRVGRDKLEPGQLPGNFISKYISGIASYNTPLMEAFTSIYTTTQERVRIDTQKDIHKLHESDKIFTEWAKKNGHDRKSKFKLIHDEKKNLRSKYTKEFYKKFYDLKQKVFDKDKKLTKEDKQWIKDNFKFDKERFDKDFERLKESFTEQVELEQESKEEMERRMEVYMKHSHYKTSDGNMFAPNNLKYFEQKDDNTEYISEEWRFIQDHEPVKQYYDTLQFFLEKWSEELGPGVINRNFIPNIRQGTIQNLVEHGAKAPFESIKRRYELRVNDEFGGKVNVETGKPIQTIPLMYHDALTAKLSDSEKSKIERQVESDGYIRGTDDFKQEVERISKSKEYEEGLKLKSTDITASFMHFAYSVNDYVFTSNIEPMIHGLKYLVDTQQATQPSESRSGGVIKDFFRGGILKKIGLDPDIKGVFEDLVNRLIYKQKYKSDIMVLDNKSSNKIIEDAMKWLSIRALGLDYVIAASNYIHGSLGLRQMAQEDVYLGKKELKNAWKMFAKHDQKYQNVVEMFVPMSRDPIEEEIELSQSSRVTRRFTTRSMFLFHIKGDDMIDYNLAVAMAQRYVVDTNPETGEKIIKNSKTKKNELWDKDAPTVLEAIQDTGDGYLEIPGLSVKERAKFKTKIHKAGWFIKGTMSPELQGSHASYIILRMLTQFKTWSFGIAKNKFGQLEYDRTMEEFEVGRFSIAFSTMFGNGFRGAFKGFKKVMIDSVMLGNHTVNEMPESLKAKYKKFIHENGEYSHFTMEQFRELQESRLRGFASEMRAYIAVIMITQMFIKAGWDDDDEDIFTRNAYKITRRAFLELSFWLNPRSVTEVVNNPLPLLGMLEEVDRLISVSIREVNYSIEGERAPNAKTPTYYMLKQTPVANQVFDFFGYFDMYNPPKGSLDHLFDIFDDQDDDEE